MHSAAAVALVALAASAVSGAPAPPPPPPPAGPGPVAPHPGPPSPPAPPASPAVQNLKNKVKNFIVLVMENRSLDNLLGGQTIKGLDNPINNGPFCNPLNVSRPELGEACSHASDYNSVIDDPDHAVYGNNMEFFSSFNPEDTSKTPSMKGFVHEQIRSYGSKANSTFLAKQVMNYYTEEQVSVLTALTQNFVTFNHWHSDIPGPTNPNRVALHSGTSAGYGDNSFTNGVMNQRSIFQQLTESNHTWTNYVEATMTDALWFNWTYTSNSTNLVKPLANFYTDAAAGTLPEYTVLAGSCCSVGTSSMHPSGLISDGETLIKNIYEAIRASPQWEETAFLLTFDETGGFHDHVAPPNAVRPDDKTYTHSTPSGQNYTFNFDRLGGRLPTWLISPWVQKGFVEQKGHNAQGSEVSYSASSMLRTLGYLYDFEPFNPRVEQAASFEGLIGDKLRKDTPEKLPEVYVW